MMSGNNPRFQFKDKRSVTDNLHNKIHISITQEVGKAKNITLNQLSQLLKSNNNNMYSGPINSKKSYIKNTKLILLTDVFCSKKEETLLHQVELHWNMLKP